jgi:hypothetical protein
MVFDGMRAEAHRSVGKALAHLAKGHDRRDFEHPNIFMESMRNEA